ncbi:hypothetical protein [Salinimicrobium flavum]|uniref:Uncharacterized protein n=1 Tax=Salinimicrobium flavum TaxID=1737065 RepID=A0ABW5ISJ5_9FLAO
MLKRLFLPSQMVLLFLLLFGSSTGSFSANFIFSVNGIQEAQHDSNVTSLIDDQVVNLGDSILPAQKTIFFLKGSMNKVGDLYEQTITHTNISQNYIKRSRYIFPSLGVKEVIFPFHVFL